ncbi:hypothetical protein [Streptomyces sp. NPDC017260]|uniref:hypothetical protein n=1 Tax=unclassified Streptomyces TaxID=2593676 RepID=UPI00379FBFF8
MSALAGRAAPATAGQTDSGGVFEMTADPNKRSDAGMDAAGFPDDVMRGQDAWSATCDALAVARRRDSAVLRRRLLRLSVRL